MLYNSEVGFHTNGLYIGKTFPTNLSDYKSNLLDIIAVFKEYPHAKPEAVVVENEPLFGERQFSIDMYCDMLKLNYELWTPLGVQVCTGGAVMPALDVLTWNWLKETGKTAEAADYRSQCDNKIYLSHLPNALQEIQAINDAGLNIKYNIHLPFSSDTVKRIPTILSTIKTITAMDVICNEMSFWEQDESLTKAGLEMTKDLSYCGIYNTVGEQGKAKPLNKKQMNIFKKYIAA